MTRQIRKKFSVTAVLLSALMLVLFFAISPGDSAAQKGPVTKANPKLPRLVDVGADKCIPCVMMAPILEELKKEYEGVLDVEFVDVWKNPQAGRKYGIRGIPTQIFYDANGKELKRHFGYISKQGILDEFKKLGIPLKPASEKGKS